MPSQISVSSDGLTELQRSIMQFVTHWVRTEKTPVPKVEIMMHMKSVGVKEPTLLLALSSLTKKKYIRRSFAVSRNISYVQQMTI